MYRKWIPIILIMVFAMGTSTMAYMDMEGHWAENAVHNLSNISVIKGYQDDTFRPDNNMTRAELIAMVNRLLGTKEETMKYIPDVVSTAWYYQDVRKAISAGIVFGDENGNMNPDKDITREETIVILSRAFGITTSTLALNSFSDGLDVSDWAKQSFSAFVKQGYIKGYLNDNTVKPRAKITRAEVVTILDRIFSEIIKSGNYRKDVTGNLLVNGEGIQLSNLDVAGNLIVAEGTNGDIELKNIDINGDLILRVPLDIEKKNILVNGKVIRLYEDKVEETEVTNFYENLEYGIKFSIPNSIQVIHVAENKAIDYAQNNIVTIQMEQDEDLHFESFKVTSRRIVNRYANIYREVLYKELNTTKIAIYDDSNDSQLIIIKRDDVVYTILLYRMTYKNVADNIVATLELTEGSKIEEHFMNVYKNSKLNLKFKYIDYIGVDDSYNTQIVFEGQSYFKLFIQVNTITDIDKYSFEETKDLLEMIARQGGELIESRNRTIHTYDAVEFVLKDGEKMSLSLYVIIEDRLYNFIFTGLKEQVESIGEELFEDVISTLEF